MFQKILTATDGTEGADKALDVAAELAQRCGADFHVLVVEEGRARLSDAVGGPPLRDPEAERIATLRKRIEDIAVRRATPAQIHLFAGAPVQTIAEFAEDNRFDLLVIGAASHGHLHTALFGSRAGDLVQHAPCSVMIVK